MHLNHIYTSVQEPNMIQELATSKEIVDRLLDYPRHQNRFRPEEKTEIIPLRCPIQNITDEECYALASITPLLGVNKTCEEQSLTYLAGLFDSGENWAKNSKISNSFYRVKVWAISACFSV